MDNEWQKLGITWRYVDTWICYESGQKWIGLICDLCSSFLAKAAHKEKELGLAENNVKDCTLP